MKLDEKSLQKVEKAQKNLRVVKFHNAIQKLRETPLTHRRRRENLVRRINELVHQVNVTPRLQMLMQMANVANI